MDDSKKEASSGILHGTVFRAGYQSQGRGRISGRNWYSLKGQNLLFTLVLRRAMLIHELNHMPLLSGAALLSAVSETTGLEFCLKWPNDLLYKGKKCAGILCEADSEYFYCGIGVNCNQVDFPGDISEKSSSLKLITGRDVSADELLIGILQQFKHLLEAGELWRNIIEKSLNKLGEVINVNAGRADSEEIIKGINRGIGEDGQLLVEKPDGSVSEIYAGEIEI